VKLTPDVLVASRYQLVECLGAGAMGEVWRARDTRFETRTVAVKFLREDETLKEDQLNRDRLLIRLEQHASRGTLSFESALGSVVAALGTSNPEGVRSKLTSAIGHLGAIRPADVVVVFDDLVNDPTLNDNARMRAKLRRLFRDEANAVANLRHDNIVSIFDYGDHEGSPYLVMDYIEGRTLYHIIQERQTLKYWQRLQWIEDLCAGLGYAHRHKLVHRDIKPANLIIDGSTRSLKILDFGVVRRLGSASTVGVPVGTFCYMSPEQTKGAATLDHRSDIFAVGLVLYELMTGKKAYPPGKSIGDLVARIQRDPPPDPLTIDPTIPDGVQAIINKAIQKLPENRYPELTIMGRELSRLRMRLEQQEQNESTGVGTPDDVRTVLKQRTPQQLAADLLMAAQRAFESGDDKTAGELVSRVLTLVPDDATAASLQRRLEERKLDARVRDMLQPAEKFLALEEITSARAALAAAEGLAPGSPAVAAFKAKLDAAATARLSSRERVQRERQQREEEQRAQQARAQEQERVERERREREERQRQQARVEREQRERDERAREQARLASEQKARAEQERLARENAEREQRERERLAAEQQARDEQERLAREKAEREQREREERERQQAAEQQAREQERLAREQRERQERERLERERREREEKAREQERLAREQKAREERERFERELREQRERAEQERVERERAQREKEQLARDEQARLHREAAEKAERARKQKEAEEAERQSRLREVAQAAPLETPASDVTMKLTHDMLRSQTSAPAALSQRKVPLAPPATRGSAPPPPKPASPPPSVPPVPPAVAAAAGTSGGATATGSPPRSVGPTRKSRRHTIKLAPTEVVTPPAGAAGTIAPHTAPAPPSPGAVPAVPPPAALARTRTGISPMTIAIIAGGLLLVVLAIAALVWIRSSGVQPADPPSNAITPATPPATDPPPAVQPPATTTVEETPPAAAATTTVFIDLRPWARVKIVPGTPNPAIPTDTFYAPFAIDLPPGDYNLEAENGGLTRATTFQLKVAEGAPMTFVRNMPGFNATKIVEGLLGRD
jgi:serine/threonine protein kinase